MVNLSISGDSIVFEFINSNYYLQNGKIATPINSLALITDESNIATFKKASSNDIFVAATYDELGKSKNELIEWFKDNAVGATGGGDLDDYYTKEETDDLIEESVSGKADTSAFTSYTAATDARIYDLETVLPNKMDILVFQEYSASVDTEISLMEGDIIDVQATLVGKTDVSAFTAYTSATETVLGNKADSSALTDYFDGVEYNSVNKTIEFYNGNVLKDSIDATDFIKDGMVDNVSISGGNLVITFNTDAGKEDIEIPLTDIFNPNNYYDKTATDGLLDAKVDVTAYTAYTSSTETALNGKASQTDLNTVSGNVDTLSGDMANKVDVSAYTAYTSATDTAIQGKASQTDLDTVSGDVANKVDTSAFTAYTSATDTALNGKADTSDLANYVEVTAYTSYTSATDTALNGKASQTDLETVSGNVDTVSGDVANKVDTSAFTAYTSATDTALQGKADASDLANKVDTSAFTAYTSATDTALQGKADASDLANKVDVSAYTAYTSATDTALQGKADASDLANKVDVSAYTAYTSATDTALQGKASQSDLNTVSGNVDTVSGTVANKQDTLVSGTNIKTINNTSLLGSGNIDIQGGGTVDDELDINSDNAVANSAITKAIQDNELVIANAFISLQEDVDGKADASALANKVDVSAYTAYTSATDTALQGKADASDLNGKVDVSAYTAYTAATDTALNGKQATLVSGTNIKTINNTSLLGSGNINVQGGGGQTVTSVTQAEYDELVTKDPDTFYIISDATGSSITIDSSLDTGSTNPVANSAITTALNSKASQTDLNTVSAATSANTTALGGYSLWKGTQVQYDAILTKDEDTIYFIVNNS